METADAITRCPERGHPWTMHSYDGCDVGPLAPLDERCRCLQPIPRLPGEDLDEAVARLGQVSSAEMNRLLSGSRVVEHLQELLTEHLVRAADDVAELSDTVIDIEGWLDQLANESANAEIDGMTQATVREVVAPAPAGPGRGDHYAVADP